MLPAHALRPLLRYFDAVDEVVSKGVVAARPHPEISLTSDLCSLMDESEQGRYAMRHDVAWLRTKLGSRFPLADLDFGIETLEYPTSLENFVTQADLGVVVEFRDGIVRGRDWQAAVLLQAKRLYLDSGGSYSAASTYGAINTAQTRRIKALHRFLGYDVVRYLLYTPRPDVAVAPGAPLALDAGLARSLQHRRDLNIRDPIFDFATGLAVHRELTRTRRVVNGGMVIAPVGRKPTNLPDTYDRIFSDSLPWAWFLSLLLVEDSGTPWQGLGAGTAMPQRLDNDALRGLRVSPIDLALGNHTAAGTVADYLVDQDLVSDSVPTFPFLPKRALRIRVTVDDSRDRDRDLDYGGR